MRTVLTSLFFALCAAPAVAAPVPLTADKLHVRLDVSPEAAKELHATESWPEACATLGKSLTAGSGPWGLGPFSGYDCGTGVDAKLPVGTWTLRVSQEKERMLLTLTLAGLEKPLASASFEGREWGLGLLSASGMTQLLSAQLLEQLPMLGRLNEENYNDQRREITGRTASGSVKLPPAPTALSVYTLTLDSEAQLFRPTYVATAKMTSKNKNGPFVWKLQSPPPTGAVLWVHNAQGRKANSKQLAKRIASLTRTLLARQDSWAGSLGLYNLGDVVTGSVSAGYVGMRYGRSLFRGPVIEKMSFISFLVELRGAPLDGLRLYYDVWPTVQQPADEGAVLFKGQRLTLGWSLDMKLNGFISRLDIVPKLGLWSVETDIAVRDAIDNSTRLPFIVHNALSLGLEAGAESQQSFGLIRAWVSRDFGWNPLEKKSPTSVTNTRAGLDTWIKGPYFSFAGAPVNLSFLVFGLYENVSLAKTGKDQDADLSVAQVDYNVGYVGGGLALSW